MNKSIAEGSKLRISMEKGTVYSACREWNSGWYSISPQKSMDEDAPIG
jgi:hypothetical protein